MYVFPSPMLGILFLHQPLSLIMQTLHNFTMYDHHTFYVVVIRKLSVSHDHPLGILSIVPITDALAVMDRHFRHGDNSENCVTFICFIVFDVQIKF